VQPGSFPSPAPTGRRLRRVEAYLKAAYSEANGFHFPREQAAADGDGGSIPTVVHCRTGRGNTLK
jgi:hypothetical protein